jgi:hypothetical protein
MQMLLKGEKETWIALTIPYIFKLQQLNKIIERHVVLQCIHSFADKIKQCI